MHGCDNSGVVPICKEKRAKIKTQEKMRKISIHQIMAIYEDLKKQASNSMLSLQNKISSLTGTGNEPHFGYTLGDLQRGHDQWDSQDKSDLWSDRREKIRQWNTPINKDDLHYDNDDQAIVRMSGEESKWKIKHFLQNPSSYSSDYDVKEVEGASTSHLDHDEVLNYSLPALDEKSLESQTSIQPLDGNLRDFPSHVYELKNTSIKPPSSRNFSHFLDDEFVDTTSSLSKSIHDGDLDNKFSFTPKAIPLPSIDIKPKPWPSFQSIKPSSDFPSTKSIPNKLESPLGSKPIIEIKSKSLQTISATNKIEFPVMFPEFSSKEVSLPAPASIPAINESSQSQSINFPPPNIADKPEISNLKPISSILSAIDLLPNQSCKVDPSQTSSTTTILPDANTRYSNHVNNTVMESNGQKKTISTPYGTSNTTQAQVFSTNNNSSLHVQPEHVFNVKHESLPSASNSLVVDTSPLSSKDLPQPSFASIPAHNLFDTKRPSLLSILSSSVASSIASITSLETSTLPESSELRFIPVLSLHSAIDPLVIPAIKSTMAPHFNSNDLPEKSHLSSIDVKSKFLSDPSAPSSATNENCRTLNLGPAPYVDGSTEVQNENVLREAMYNQPGAFIQGEASLESLQSPPVLSFNMLAPSISCIGASKLIEKGKVHILPDLKPAASHSSDSSDSTNAKNELMPSFQAYEIPLISIIGQKSRLHAFQTPFVPNSSNSSALEKLEDCGMYGRDTIGTICPLHNLSTQPTSQQSDSLSSPLSSHDFYTSHASNALAQKSRDDPCVEDNPLDQEFSSIPLSDISYLEQKIKAALPRTPVFSETISKISLSSDGEPNVEVPIPSMLDLLSTHDPSQPKPTNNETCSQRSHLDIGTSNLLETSSINELPCSEQSPHVTFTQDEAISILPPANVNIEPSDTYITESSSQASFHNVLTNVEQSAAEVLSTIVPPLKRKLSMFFGVTTPHLPLSLSSINEEEHSLEPTRPSNELDVGLDDDDDDDEHAPKAGNFNMQNVKKKMSLFLANRMPSLAAGTSANETYLSHFAERAIDDSKFDGSEMPSFYNQAASSSYTESHSPDEEAVAQGRYQKRVPKAKKFQGAMQNQHQVHLLTNFQLIAITFFAVSGGPYGFEPTVGAGGPRLMLVGLLFFPVLWAAPLAYMTAELSCMIPESGGHVLWVYRAFGPFWSFVNSCFAFACSVLDNAMYPVLFVEYISALFYEDSNSFPYGWSVFLKVFIVFIVTIINILGVDIVGFASVTLGLMMLAPLATMCLLGLFRLNFDWMDSTSSGSGAGPAVVDWQKFVTLLLWNTSGFDAAGTCAAEVRNPSQSYPHALKISVALIVAVYAVPTIIGVSVIPNYAQWTEGTYVIVSKIIGGNLLKSWMGLSAASSALGLLLTRLCFNSRIVYGMALVEQVPPVFAKIHPTYATPWVAILATSLCTLLLTGFNFYSIAEADMLFYACSTILKFAALVQLRFTEPDAFRPYRIPIETIPLAVCAIVPISLCVLIIWLSSEHAHGIVLAGASAAILLFSAKEFCTQYGDEAEEAVNHRMTRMQENLNKMQRRIDEVIWEEFSAPLSNLGDAIRFSNRQLRSGLQRHITSRPTVEQSLSYTERDAGRIS